ncbi:MAG: hypothetical protein JWQ88_2880 [Rhodoferax sp.]|nr:hypothetical protein [Rhodoferax sp.]
MTQELNAILTQSYDEVPYQSHPFAQSAPEHLQAIAHLFGLPAARPERARVLELGCASGGNLIPFAARYPQACAVGVDLSPVQVADGQQNIARAGLRNVALKNLNLEQIDASLGEFDYIICHGVYSWVPPTVQAAILRICAENLAPDGVAYISYNTYPGWKAREIVRDAMLLRSADRDTPAEKLAYARGMVDFLHEMSQPDSVLRKTLDETQPLIKNGQSYYLMHEFLEACNAPCYFKDFLAAAGKEQLAYLADATPQTMFVSNYGAKAAEPLLKECGGSQVMMEQYLDFLVNRAFRQTLLVKQPRAGSIRYKLDNARIEALQFAGHFRFDNPLTLDAAPQACKSLHNISLTLHLPVHKAVALALNAHYPATVKVRTLAQDVGRSLSQPATAVLPAVLSLLNEWIVAGTVRYRLAPVKAPDSIPDRPLVMASARQAALADRLSNPPAAICNAWHDEVALTLVQRHILPLLDGKHAHDELVAHLLGAVQAGTLNFHRDGQLLTQAEALADAAREHLQEALVGLRFNALLC